MSLSRTQVGAGDASKAARVAVAELNTHFLWCKCVAGKFYLRGYLYLVQDCMKQKQSSVAVTSCVVMNYSPPLNLLVAERVGRSAPGYRVRPP